MRHILPRLFRRPAEASAPALPEASSLPAPDPASAVAVAGNAPAAEPANPAGSPETGLDIPAPTDDATAIPLADFEALFGSPVEASASPSGTPAEAARKSPRRRSRAWSGSPLQLIADLALDEEWTAALGRDLAGRRPLVVLITVPAATWVKPVKSSVLSRLTRPVDFLSPTKRERSSSSASPDLDAVHTMGRGETLIAITPDPGWLPPVVVAAADHVLSLKPLSPAQVTKAVTLWTGRALKQPIEAGDLTGLDLPDIAAALRPRATPAACLKFLKRASTRRVGPPAGGGGVIPLEQMTGIGPAQAWALELVAAIQKVKAGRLSPALLESAVLFGPPGTGKSTLARSIAAAAGVPYLETSVGTWFSQSAGHLDGVIKEIDRYCDSLILAAKSAGAGTAIGFLDEIDALPNRARLSDRAADWWLPVITHCLLRIESLRRAGIVLLAATNALSRVDAALLRPGRLDQGIEMPPPDEAGRLSALRHHLGRDLRDEDVTPAVRLSRGATGAVLAGAVRAARRRADAAGRAMTLADLLAEVAPADGRSPADLRAAALHEAGHAVLGLRLGLVMVGVSIQAGEASGGSTIFRRHDPTPDRAALERQVVSLLAGRAADGVLGTGADAGAARDLREATRLLAALHRSFGLGERLIAPVDHEHADEWLRLEPDLARQVEQDLQRLQATADLLVRANRAAILAVADALIANRVLTGEEVAAIIAAHPPRLRVPALTGRSCQPLTSGAMPPRGPEANRSPNGLPRDLSETGAGGEPARGSTTEGHP